MPKSIIPDPSGIGDFDRVLHLPEALELHEGRHRNQNVVGLVRVSGDSDIRNGRLARMEANLRADVLEVGGGVLEVVGNVKAQNGKLSCRRPDLSRAFDLGRRRRAIVCVPSVDRLVRAKAFDPVRNYWAAATPGEVRRVVRMAGNVLIASVEPPDAPPRDVHRRATIRGMIDAATRGCTVGRPSDVDDELLEAILFLRQYGDGDPRGFGRLLPLRRIAKALQFDSHGLVQRALNRTAPVRSGRRWADLLAPYDAWKAYRKGVRFFSVR